jgi:hypothetical protein
MIHDLDQPGLRVSGGIKLHQSDEKRFLNEVACVLLFKPVFPGRSADEGKKVPTVKLVEAIRVGQ